MILHHAHLQSGQFSKTKMLSREQALSQPPVFWMGET